MTEKEAAKYLVELYAAYERYANELHYGTSQKYSEAVSMAIMALKPNEPKFRKLD